LIAEEQLRETLAALFHFPVGINSFSDTAPLLQQDDGAHEQQ
jgi:hypothetical protein